MGLHTRFEIKPFVKTIISFLNSPAIFRGKVGEELITKVEHEKYFYSQKDDIGWNEKVSFFIFIIRIQYKQNCGDKTGRLGYTTFLRNKLNLIKFLINFEERKQNIYSSRENNFKVFSGD